MSQRKLSISNGSPDGYKVAVDDHDISAGLRRVVVDIDSRSFGRPRVDVGLAIDAIEVVSLGVAESDFMVSMSDEARAALVALGWTPPGSPRPPQPGVIRSDTWEVEAHTRPREDDHRYLAEEPTGWLTFTCGCGHRIHDRNTTVLAQARTHLAEQHPDWEQIPDDDVVDSPEQDVP